MIPVNSSCSSIEKCSSTIATNGSRPFQVSPNLYANPNGFTPLDLKFYSFYEVKRTLIISATPMKFGSLTHKQTNKSDCCPEPGQTLLTRVEEQQYYRLWTTPNYGGLDDWGRVAILPLSQKHQLRQPKENRYKILGGLEFFLWF